MCVETVVGPLHHFSVEGWGRQQQQTHASASTLIILDVSEYVFFKLMVTGQVGLGVGSWPSNRATEGSNPKGTRLYFVILLKNVEKIFDWH